MAYQYLQMLPKLAENPANKVIVVPTDYAGLVGVATALGSLGEPATGTGIAPGNGSRVPTAPALAAPVLRGDPARAT